MQEIVALKKRFGKYICFIDSDDFIDKDYIKVLYDLCNKYNCDIAECDLINWNNNENIEINQPVKQEKVYSPIEKTKRIYGKEHIRSIVAWNKLYNRKLFEDINYAFGKTNEDEFTTYKVFDKANNIVETNQKLYYYAYSPNSIMRRKFNKKRLDYIEALEERMIFFKKKKEIELYQLTKNKYCYTLIEFYHRVKNDIENSERIQKDLRKKLSKSIFSIILMRHIKLKSKVKLVYGYLFPRTYCKKYLKI